MEENGMRFPGVRSPEENDIRFFDLLIGVRTPACSENHRQTGDARSMSSTVTAVDVVASHHDASEFLRDEIHFVRSFRATEHSECPGTTLIQGSLQSIRRP